MGKKRKTAKGSLIYPKHQFAPEDILNFIELKPFTHAWDNQLNLSDDDLAQLQVGIMMDPKHGELIVGTGGLRKLRFSPSSWNRGKSGALRVCYVYFEKYGLVVLVLVYTKNEKETLTAAEKSVIHRLIERIEEELIKR